MNEPRWPKSISRRHFTLGTVVLLGVPLVKRTILGPLASNAQEATAVPTQGLKFNYRKFPTGGQIYITHFGHCEVTVTFDLSLTNATADIAGETSLTLAPLSNTVVANVKPIDPTKSVDWEIPHFDWRWGRQNAKHDDDYSYLLPYELDTAHRVLQGYDGSFSHSGTQRYCLDFTMPEGTKIYAARDGKVVQSIGHFTENGRTKDFMSKANLVRIAHSDGTLSMYLHLLKDGNLVKIGQKVKAGQQIGLSGNTGYSTEPHLHFGVQRALTGKDWETIKTRFKTSEAERTLLEQGKTYTRV